MYGLKLSFKIIDIVNQQPAPITVSQLCSLLSEGKILDHQKHNLRTRVLRRVHELADLEKISIEYKETAIKTQYLIIQPC